MTNLCDYEIDRNDELLFVVRFLFGDGFALDNCFGLDLMVEGNKMRLEND